MNKYYAIELSSVIDPDTGRDTRQYVEFANIPGFVQEGKTENEIFNSVCDFLEESGFSTDTAKIQEWYLSPVKRAACIYIKLKHTDLVLLATRRRKSVEDEIRYGLPGGKVDPGETFIQAAIRECYEETGIVLVESDLTHVFTQVCIGKADAFNPAVDYETACYYAELASTYVPGGIEEGIHAVWGTHEDLLKRSDFHEYNAVLLEKLPQVTSTI